MSKLPTFAAYEREAMITQDYPRVERTREAVDADGIAILHLEMLPVYPMLAMCGESGEAAEKVKKAWRDSTELDKVATLRELGDVLWYVTAAARDLGFSLEDVAQANIDKLRDRRSRGVLGGSGDDR